MTFAMCKSYHFWREAFWRLSKDGQSKMFSTCSRPCKARSIPHVYQAFLQGHCNTLDDAEEDDDEHWVHNNYATTTCLDYDVNKLLSTHERIRHSLNTCSKGPTWAPTDMVQPNVQLHRT
jgi:hypothetical protein